MGDTSSDTGMGKNSNAGLVVGVLTGSGTKDQLLRTGAHIVLPNVDHLPKVLAGSEKLISGNDDSGIVGSSALSVRNDVLDMKKIRV